MLGQAVFLGGPGFAEASPRQARIREFGEKVQNYVKKLPNVAK